MIDSYFFKIESRIYSLLQPTTLDVLLIGTLNCAIKLINKKFAKNHENKIVKHKTVGIENIIELELVVM